MLNKIDYLLLGFFLLCVAFATGYLIIIYQEGGECKQDPLTYMEKEVTRADEILTYCSCNQFLTDGKVVTYKGFNEISSDKHYNRS